MLHLFWCWRSTSCKFQIPTMRYQCLNHPKIDIKHNEMPIGGSSFDHIGVPLTEETFAATKQSDVVLLGAIGGYKWDNLEKKLMPETGLLQLRAGLDVFANLRPAAILPQLVDCTTLKREVAEGVDLMVVRELTAGIYFGEPGGITINEKGEEISFNTEVFVARRNAYNVEEMNEVREQWAKFFRTEYLVS